MAIIGSSILELEYSQINSPSIVGELATGLTVTIEVWKEGVIVSLVSNVCVEIGSIGQYSWSIGNIASVSAPQTQYHYRMTDNLGGTFDGDFILKTQEGQDGVMPSLNDKSSYIISI